MVGTGNAIGWAMARLLELVKMLLRARFVGFLIPSRLFIGRLLGRF